MMCLRFTAIIPVAMFLATTAHAAPTAEQKCQASKNQAAGKYAFCRQKAEKKLVLTGDVSKYNVLLATCDAKLDEAWLKAEQKAADDSATCPDVPLSLAQLKYVIGAYSDNIAQALGGAALLGPAPRLKTGQTQCDQGDTSMGACPGTPAGQDGALQFGVARSLTDNGDGTITDQQTALMWEKLSDDGSIHDWRDSMIWSDAFTKIATLNTGAFAGYTDWRLPNANELQSLGYYGGLGIDPVLNTNCILGCNVLTCSCSTDTWSSTSSVMNSINAFYLSPPGRLAATDKSEQFNVSTRAVRGGR